MPAPTRAELTETLIRRLTWTEIDPAYLRRLIELARDEDLAGHGLRKKPRLTGDRSTAALTTAPRQSTAHLVARQDLIPCGLPLIPLILSLYGAKATHHLRAPEGRLAPAGTTLATLTGDPRALLSAERVILNFLQRLSGIATQTSRYVAALGETRTRLLDTRKTTPGYRVLEKYAVATGGGWNHRLGLFDRVMLKDNHLAILGYSPTTLKSSPSSKSAPSSPNRLSAAITRAREAAPDLPVEVEIDHPSQIAPVLQAGADIILLDNFTPAQLRSALQKIGGRAFTEASGGITLKTLPRLASLGLDFISTGALVHQSTWVDIGLDWEK